MCRAVTHQSPEGLRGPEGEGGAPGGKSPFVGLMGDVKSKALHGPRVTSEQTLTPRQPPL